MRKLLLVALLGLAAAVLWGWMLGRADERAARLHATLMRPYFQAVVEGHWERAWSQFTTARYRRMFPLADYVRAQKDRQWVALSRIESPRALASLPGANDVRIKYYDLTFLVDGNPPIVIYDIVETTEGPKIDASYRMIWRIYASKTGRKASEEERLEEPW